MKDIDFDSFDFEQDMSINPDALDLEWLEQPELHARYALAYAKAQRLLSRAEEKKKTLRSELILECLDENPKAKNAEVEAYYRSADTYKEAVEELNELQYQKEMLFNGLQAISFSRKAALESLVKLASIQYISVPSVPLDTPKRRREELKERTAKDKVKSAMKTKKRAKRTTKK